MRANDEGALSCKMYISQLEYFMQINVPHVDIGTLRGNYFNQTKLFKKSCNSTQEGKTTRGGSLNQSESTICSFINDFRATN